MWSYIQVFSQMLCPRMNGDQSKFVHSPIPRPEDMAIQI